MDQYWNNLAYDRHELSDCASELIRRWRVLEKERRETPMPAIALTAYATSKDRAQCLDAGFLNHIAKPVDRNELLAVIRSLGISKRSSTDGS